MKKVKKFAAAPEKSSPLDFFGEMVSAEELTRAGWRSSTAIPTITNPSSVWRILKSPHGAQAMRYYDDFEEKNGHYSAQLESRKEAVMSRKHAVIAASENPDDEKVRDAVIDMLRGIPNLHDVLEGLLDCLGKGVAIAEIIWAPPARIVSVKSRPQELFSFGTFSQAQTGDLRLVSSGDIDGIPVPADKFIVLTYKPKHGNRWGSPIGRKVFWLLWFKTQGVRTWLKYLEKGTGTVVTKYSRGAGDDEKNKALQAAKTINDDVACAISEGLPVELLDKSRSGSTDSYLSWVREFCDSEISRVVLGQTLTSHGSEGGGSRALGEVHAEVRAEKMKADSQRLMDAINDQLIRHFVDFNFGFGVAAPRWSIDIDDSIDLQRQSVIDARLQQMGLPISAADSRKVYGKPEPKDEADTLKPLAVDKNPLTVDGARVGFAGSGLSAHTAEIHRVVGEALSAGTEQYETLIQDILREVHT